MEKRLSKIYDHFGKSTQLLKLAEEAGELAQAAFEFSQGECSKEDLLGEYVDTFSLMMQMMLGEFFTADEFERMLEFKMARTEERIKSGYYNEVAK